MFHYFLSDDRKQDAATTTTHSNSLIELKKIDVELEYNMGKY